jgi:hypothetical protein
MTLRIFCKIVGFCARSNPAVRTVLSFIASNRPSPAGKRHTCEIFFTFGDAKPAAISPRVHSSGSL